MKYFDNTAQHTLRRNKTFFESGALSGKMLFVRIIKNYKVYAYFRSG